MTTCNLLFFIYFRCVLVSTRCMYDILWIVVVVWCKTITRMWGWGCPGVHTHTTHTHARARSLIDFGQLQRCDDSLRFERRKSSQRSRSFCVVLALCAVRITPHLTSRARAPFALLCSPKVQQSCCASLQQRWYSIYVIPIRVWCVVYACLCDANTVEMDSFVHEMVSLLDGAEERPNTIWNMLLSFFVLLLWWCLVIFFIFALAVGEYENIYIYILYLLVKWNCGPRRRKCVVGWRYRSF